jgi:RimJ/RimL family protein N-acetyltransferase
MIRLRHLSVDDVPAITALLRDDYEGVMQTSRIPWPFDEADAAAFVERALSGSETAWAVEETASGAFAGVIGVIPGDETEVGYWIGKPFRGRGFASEAVRLVLEHLRSLRGLTVRAHAFVENPASARVLQKNGFTRAGQVERDMPLRGGIRRLDVFVLDLTTSSSG